MPIFQAAITSSYDSVQEAILITDSSDYVGNTQPSHALDKFGADSFYFIGITKPDLSQFTWSNELAADIAIPSPSLNIFDGSHILLPADGSGSYVNKLVVVPAWELEQTYNQSENDTVFHNGNFWNVIGTAFTIFLV